MSFVSEVVRQSERLTGDPSGIDLIRSSVGVRTSLSDVLDY